MGNEKNIINSPDEFSNKLKEIKSKDADTADSSINVNHAQIASLTIKILNTIKIDPFVRKVMTLRIMGPLITGKEKTHLSIALELGAVVDDVVEAEKYGVALIGEMMEKFSNKDFIEKFNRDEAVNRAVQIEMGKSASDMRNPKQGE